MIDWLVAHAASAQFCVLLGGFAALAAWETWRPLRPAAASTVARWVHNLALAGLGAALVRVCVPVAGLAVAALAARHGIGVLHVVALPAPLAFAIGVLAFDATHYALHRLVHALPWLWRIHKIHHADLDVDCATALRHHPLETLFIGGCELVAIAAIGASPLAVLAASLLAAAVSLFSHANVGVSPVIDRALRAIVVTPDMHRIHHSLLADESNANFATVFSCWDRCFGTFRAAPAAGRERMVVGIADARTPREVSLLRSLAMPFERRSATPA